MRRRAAGGSRTVPDIGGAMVKAVGDLKAPVMAVILLACYALAILAFIQGCFRVLRHANSGGGGPPLWGAGLSFLMAAVLAWVPNVLWAAGETFFAGSTASAATLGYATRGAGYEKLLAALFWAVNVVGLLAFVKGLFVLRGASDGAPGATVSGAAMHMAGGVMAWHIVPLIGAVQATLGISVLTIS